MRHYSETELIEVHFLPGENETARFHVAHCEECAGRMSRVTEILGAHAAGPENAADAKSEFFWERQTAEIRRKIAANGATHRVARFVSIAAMLLVLVGGSLLVTRRQNELTKHPATSVATTTASAAKSTTSQDEVLLEELQSDHDAWSADQLKPYHGAVEWESWLSTDPSSSGGKS